MGNTGSHGERLRVQPSLKSHQQFKGYTTSNKHKMETIVTLSCEVTSVRFT